VQGEDRLNLLLDTLARVSISVELHPTLQILLDSLQSLIAFDAGGIFVPEDGRPVLRARASRGFSADLEVPFAKGILGEVLQTGTPRLVHDVTKEPAYIAFRPSTNAQLTVPLSSPRGILGAISLEADSALAFDAQDLTLVTLFAQQATVAIERALLHEHVIQQSRLEHEIQIAREIVQSLTPTAVPSFRGMQVFGRSLTAEVVGGDSFDFVPYPEAQLGVSIADAKGKGLPGALLAVAHRAMLRALVGMELRLRAMFNRMSALLAQSVGSGNFVTAFYGIVDVSERRMVYANAGHPPPLLMRANGECETLAVTGSVLGFPNVTPMREAYAVFGSGDGLVLFTDGVTDVGPTPEEFFDVGGVQETARRLWDKSAADICNGLLDEVSRRANGALPDDSTIVVLKFD
jgi:sigma-B regulation protein RsbU (phosphoserine phosphatase)